MRIRALLLALAVFAGLTVAAPANAGSSQTYFYSAKSCSVSPDGKARLSVTNWDLNSKTQRYHMDINGMTYPVAYYPVAIYFNGVRQNGTSDIYKNVSPVSSINTIKAVWRVGLTQVSCSVRG